MHTEKISEIIAHFIGLFEAETDQMRMRDRYLEGRAPAEEPGNAPAEAAAGRSFRSDLELKDYAANVSYSPPDVDLMHPHSRLHIRHTEPGFADTRHHHPFHDGNALPDAYFSAPEQSLEHYTFRFGHRVQPEEIDRQLVTHAGPGSVIEHGMQINVLQDDDYLNMTDGPNVLRDTTFVVERLAEYSDAAEVYTPFSQLDRTDTAEGLVRVYEQMREFSQEHRDTAATLDDDDDDADDANDHDGEHDGISGGSQISIAAQEINGTYINGELTDERPDLNDFMPDRGIAKPAEEPDDSQSHWELHGSGANTLDVGAGANVVANILSITDTSIIAPVTAVMGNYYQIDAITQVTVHIDDDQISAPDGSHSSGVEGVMDTVARNIASFERSEYEPSTSASHAADGGELIFPSAWRVSVVEGDVSFVHWVEQYNFVTDNDTMTVTTTGSEATVLTGGNAAVNLASYLGIGLQYDLVIVGGHIYDINAITQVSLLYDKDWIDTGNGSDATLQSGNNLLWNQASIHNIGSNDRFEAMPDYVSQTVKAIDDLDPQMPQGMAGDMHFAGYAGVNVLYITGSLFDVNIVKQVSVLGDSDQVILAANKHLAANEDAEVSIDTGSNAVINIAEIVDYDSFGNTTYVAGQVYSDAILIQAGLVGHDSEQPEQPGERLANEVIAFLDEHDPAGGGVDATIDGRHDLSWTNLHPADVMQTVVA